MTTTQRIAGAPISWGVSEVPGWGHQMRRQRVLAELRELGLAATEAGPDGFLPDDPGALRELLAGYDLTLAGGFTPLVLHGDASTWRRDLTSVAGRFATGGASIIVLAASTGLDDYDARPQLTNADWLRFLRGLDAAREVAGGHGLEIALHPHYGTMVETPEEIDRVLDGSTVPLCLDTGHVVLGGGDPVAIAEQAGERVAHLHLKDVDATLARSVIDGRLTFSDAVRRGVFRPLGHGDVDVRAVLDRVGAVGYDGWYVFEHDTKLQAEPNPGGGPCRDVARSLEFLQAALTTAAR
jgi:inosose dehydratase